MRMTRTAALLAVLVVMGAVSIKAANAVSSRAPDYTSSDDSMPVHAFIYADHTVVELDSYSAALAIRDDSGGNISFTKDGRYARLDGRLNHFTALVNGEPVTFTRRGWEAPHVIPVVLKPVVPAVASSALPASAPAVAAASAPVAASAALALAPNEKVVALPAAALPASGSSAAKPVAAVPPILPKPVATAAVPASAASVVVAAQSKPAAPATPLEVASVTLAASGSIVTPPVEPVPLWTLRQGHLVGHELHDMGVRAGWNVVWQLQRDVVVPADTTYSGTFEKAAGDVVTTLKSNGLLIHAKFYEGNKTMVVSGPGTVPQ